MNGKKIFGAFTLAAALFFFWPGVVGSWQEMRALRAALDERTVLNDERTKILANAATEYKKYKELLGSSDGRTFISLVPVKKDSAELVSAVQDMASGAGAQLIELRMQEEKNAKESTYKSLALTIELSGSYRSLNAFLSSLEQYVRILNVTGIEASSANTDRTGDALRFTIQATAYFIK